MASRKKQEDKHLKIIRELVAQPPNKKCFDCGQRGPTYVNMTIGAFVCTSCSGLLRGMNPPHRIKSISMASFNAQEIEFLQNHGNDICHDTWLALWDLPSAAEPESRDEQKVKDFLAKKYERKLWYSTRPKAKIPKQEPEAKPLKTLLGDNTPQVIISNQPEQKSARISPPRHVNTTSLAKPTQPVATHNEIKSNMDLLGDLGSDPFGSTLPQRQSQNQNAFGVFQQPPPPQNQQQQANVGVFSSTSFESFANSTSVQPPMDPFQTTPMNPQSSNDLFAISSAGSSHSSFSGNAFENANDRYAALSDMDLFKTSTTQSVFSGTSVFGSSPTAGAAGMQMNAQPNPFMSPGTGSSGAAVFQQQQQKAANPFQTSAAFGGQQMFRGFDTNPSNQLANNWSNFGTPSQQMNSWSQPTGGSSYANGGVNFTNISSSGGGGGGQQGMGFSVNAMNSSMAGGQQQLFGVSQYQAQSNNVSPFMQQNAFNQANFQPTQQQSAGFAGSRQQPISTSFPNQSQNFDLFGQQQQQRQQQQQQQQQQTFATNFNSQFGIQPPPQQQPNILNAFPSQPVAGSGSKPPFGGVQMPGFGHQPQQPQQPFGNWLQQSTQQRSNNPFM